MRVWLMHVSEELPVDGSNRTFRYGYLAEALLASGHEVLRWAPTFRHRTKMHRFDSDHLHEVSPGYEIQFVHSSDYTRHISLARVRAYRELAHRLVELAPTKPRPDVIVSAIPSLEWSEAAVQIGTNWNVPVVVDVRDIWPDIYLNALPKFARPAGLPLLRHEFKRVRRICAAASMLTAVSNSYLQWALGYAGRNQSDLDRVLPLGYEPVDESDSDRSSAIQLLRDLGVDTNKPICLFAGRFERSYDLGTVIRAAKSLYAEGQTDLQFVLCGGGARADKYRRMAQGAQNVFFTGWISAPCLQAIASISEIGLCAYAADATQSVPNKPYEYMASELAVVSSLPGDMQQLLDRHECGVTYEAGNPSSLKSQLDSLLGNRSKLSLMQENGRAAWERHYQSQHLYRDFVAHLEGIGCDGRSLTHAA